MSDLIRRDDALKEVLEASYLYFVNGKPLIEEIAEDVIFSAVCNVPAVDAVEVVRCCRCRFAVNKKENGEFVTYCALDWGMRGVLDHNDYCSYGKEIKRCQD